MFLFRIIQNNDYLNEIKIYKCFDKQKTAASPVFY